jgi:uncharacterized repeat protein (TIGR01451 family)
VFVVSLAVSLSFLSNAAFAQEADLAVIKSGPDTAAAGADVAYDVFVINGGPDDAAAVVLNDVIPPGMTFTSLVQNNGPTFSCSTPGPGVNGTITCNIATLPNGASADFTITLQIAPATPPATSFTNIATITSQTFDPNDENNSSTQGTSTPANDGDLAISKSGPPSAAPNSDVTYTITLANAGPSAATTVSLSDTLPGTMTFVSLNQSSGPAFICSNPGAGNGGTITCTIASMANGASASFTLVGHIPNGTPSGTTFQNNVTVTSDNDPTPENNAATTFLTISTVDLAMTKTGPPTVIAGNTLSYSITITNNGPDVAVNAQFADTLPPQAQFVGFTQNNGPAASCGNTGVPAGGTAACVFPNPLNSGQSANFTLDVLVPTSVPDGTVLTNNVTASSQSFDTNPGNDSASANTTVIGVTDLGVTKSGPTGVVAGGNITYTITVTNNGASPAATSQLTDNVPAQTTFLSFIQNSGPSAGCSTPSVGGTGTVTCNWASIAPGASAVFTFVVKTNGGASGSIINTANVTTATTDTNPANNSASSTAAVSLPADLAVTKTASPGPYGTGQLITWTITVSNGGLSPAANTTVTDVLPPGATFVSAVASVGSCSGTTTVTCNLGTLNVGANATITLKANLPPTPGVVSNTATATTTTPDSNPANDSATATVTTVPAAQLPAMSPALLLLLAAMLAGIALMARR